MTAPQPSTPAQPVTAAQPETAAQPVTAPLRGLTWDHPRGYRVLEALAATAGPGEAVRWQRQPLEDFESRPLRTLADRLDLRGYVARAELDDLYARAACALIPSRYEGFGYALAEALCAGLPAVAARSSSLGEVAADSVPLVDPDNVDAWADAVRALLQDRDRAETDAASRRAANVARFAWPAAALSMIGVYGRVFT